MQKLTDALRTWTDDEHPAHGDPIEDLTEATALFAHWAIKNLSTDMRRKALGAAEGLATFTEAFEKAMSKDHK